MSELHPQATRIGIVFSSMDRYELIRMALEHMLAGIDPSHHEVTVLWQDGSEERDALRFFERFHIDSVRLIKHGGIRGIGPAEAIERGMTELQKIGHFDWIGMVESDVYLTQDWLFECLRVAEEAKKVGLNPGIVTPYVLHMWVVEYNSSFVTMSGCGAACSLFTPNAWVLVPPVEIGHSFDTRLLERYGFPVVHKKHTFLGYDWCFAPSVYHGGFDVIGTRVSKLLNCGYPQHLKSAHKGYSYVEGADSPTWADKGPVRLGPRDYNGWRVALEAAATQKQQYKHKSTIRTKIRHRLAGLRIFLTGR
ncbi:MAG: hypothetical protein U9R44_01560 [Candidatus Omnitrophota bacterium]|nr:hypothetical protein [Candidatus Omnitrophota bacterium]